MGQVLRNIDDVLRWLADKKSQHVKTSRRPRNKRNDKRREISGSTKIERPSSGYSEANSA